MKIFKYAFRIEDSFTLMMPRGARVLSVQVQRERPCLWALVDESTEARRYFKLVGTGHEFESTGWRFLGTFQMHDGALVWHLFESEV